MPSVRTIEGFAKGDVTSAEQRRRVARLEPKVRASAVDLIRGPNRAQRGRRRGTGGLPRVGRTLNIGSPCTAAPGWHPVGHVIEGAEAVSSVGVRFGGKPQTPSPRRARRAASEVATSHLGAHREDAPRTLSLWRSQCWRWWASAFSSTSSASTLTTWHWARATRRARPWLAATQLSRVATHHSIISK